MYCCLGIKNIPKILGPSSLGYNHPLFTEVDAVIGIFPGRAHKLTFVLCFEAITSMHVLCT
jgi:hypothetical protein